MRNLGKYVSMGMEDILQKVKNIRLNTQSFCDLGLIEEESDEVIYLMKFIEFEMSLGIEKLNSVNNKKINKTLLADGKIDQSLHDFLNTPDKETKWKYWSTTFTVYLGCWFLDFYK